MSKKKFIGARIEPEVFQIVENVAKEESIDRTAAIKKLVLIGWKELKLEHSLTKYREGKISLDKAAEIAGIPIQEMMKQASLHGIKSEETLEEFKEGLNILLKG